MDRVVAVVVVAKVVTLVARALSFVGWATNTRDDCSRQMQVVARTSRCLSLIRLGVNSQKSGWTGYDL